MFNRRLGRSAIQVTALGMGTAAIGGPQWDWQFRQDQPTGYGQVDDAESLRALERALALGVTFFDTADQYGCGHAERLLGQALAGRRGQVIIATKFGYAFDEDRCEVTGADATPAAIRRACEASLRRLDTDCIDLYLFHLRDYDPARSVEVRDTLEDLVRVGKIRFYGWSTDDPARARLFAQGPHCTAVEHRLNVLLDNAEMLAVCEECDLASINRIPLLMGILTGKFRDGVHLPDDDQRSLFFGQNDAARDIAQVEDLRALLTHDGRTLTQGALGWIWARSPRTVPIPGFKTVAQVEENAGALRLGPLSPAQMAEIATLLGRPATG